MKRVAFMFPGQGSQKVGMGQDIYNNYPSIEKLYSHANDILEKDLQKMMFAGPKETLTETENAQPALLLSSIALHTLRIEKEVQPVMTVGHSIENYSTQTAAEPASLN